MASTIGDILASGKLDSFSNVKISHSMKSKLLRAIEGEEQPRQKGRITKSKERLEQLKQAVHNAKHKAFVKCVEWARTCDPVYLSGTGVM